MNKLIATALGSALLSGGAVFGALGDAPDAQKHEILKDNIWKDVRLGEIPEWDVSVVSAKEMTDAYAELAKEMNALETENLYTNLSLKAEEQGVKCR